MSTSFHFLVGRHPVDLLKIATDSDTGERQLLLMTAGGQAPSLTLSHPLPSDYPGLLGLITGDSSIIREVKNGDRSSRVVFPPSLFLAPMVQAELIDRLRFLLPGESEVGVLLNYETLRDNLPPLAHGDRVTCYWEARDALDERAISHFGELADRLADEPFGFEGVRIYARSSQTAASSQVRLCEIAEICPGLISSQPLLVIQ